MNLSRRPPWRICQLHQPGLVPYQTAWQWQQRLVAERRSDRTLSDVLILLEHPPVYTLGSGADPRFLKFDPAIAPYEIYRVERGGEVTYHCPGQLVGYPILNLHYYQLDLHWYLRQLEELIIRVLARYGILAGRAAGLTGVWIEGRKVAAIGIKASRWITMHGFALNVRPDLKGFEQIVPCGIYNCPVGSLAEFLPDIQLGQVQQDILEVFAALFQVDLQPQRDRLLA
ncbi:MAG: lipoyl(octanoyl) transferase LipB [Leptolyngbyaceae cyanobacterium SM1_1_3]|nr:lipoyl(octanoyl) transferase LipB [Leptolyngbyaceae cyanobacterium SM1_1_3]NJM85388.1 lipoyl(octanoyl) transferase LipB [Leptolyngbyaceae cyanobacterium RM2_2_21]NJN04136.1 lipoyl(octanoyl) transferase LipB [Leptolyngbyaceae cyanobacterium RM1_1_2]NJO11397.1 lipoyl(octanoyl) transferase LipB [Leptolyngbyaceae cyanobacterium SL_1_1]